MTHRNLILCMALAVVASGAVMTRIELHKRAWRREGGRRGLRLGFSGAPTDGGHRKNR
jgi:hypothetical protein